MSKASYDDYNAGDFFSEGPTKAEAESEAFLDHLSTIPYYRVLIEVQKLLQKRDMEATDLAQFVEDEIDGYLQDDRD